MLGSWRPISGILTYFAYWYSMYVYIYIHHYPTTPAISSQNILKRRMLISYELVQINLRAWTHTYMYIYYIYIPFRICNRLPHQRQSHTNRRSTAASSTLAVFISMACADQFQFQSIFTCFFFTCFFFHMFSHVFTCLLVFISSKGPNTSKIIQILHQVGTYWHSALHLIAAYQGIS